MATMATSMTMDPHHAEFLQIGNQLPPLASHLDGRLDVAIGGAIGLPLAPLLALGLQALQEPQQASLRSCSGSSHSATLGLTLHQIVFYINFFFCFMFSKFLCYCFSLVLAQETFVRKYTHRFTWLALIVGGSLTFLIIGCVNYTIGDERASPMHGEIDGMSWWAFIQGINLVSSNMVAANLQKCLRETKVTAQSPTGGNTPEVESSVLLEIPGIPFWKSWKSWSFLEMFLSVFPGAACDKVA